MKQAKITASVTVSRVIFAACILAIALLSASVVVSTMRYGTLTFLSLYLFIGMIGLGIIAFKICNALKEVGQAEKDEST